MTGPGRSWGRPLCGAGRGRAGCLTTSGPDTPLLQRKSTAPWSLTRPEQESRDLGIAAMDIPPLAGKIAALSLGALPVSYVLNHVSVLSQCVREAVGWRAALGG